MRIYTDQNGLAVNAISKLEDGTDVAGHRYDIVAGDRLLTIDFQNGPVPVAGVNGATNESLLALLIHRTEHLNALVPCPENVAAIAKMKWALDLFEQRTASRQNRGVEGSTAT